MNPATPKLGCYASIAAFIAIVTYGIVQSIQVFGYIQYPLADILIYASSLCIAVPFLLALLALDDTIEARRRLWSRGALIFAVMYVVYAALMYTVQLSVVIPRSGESTAGGVIGVLSVSPQSLFWDIDALAYIAMGIATAFAAFALPPTGSAPWPRRFLLANGVMTPVIAFIYFYPHFSTAVLLIGSPWLITASGSMLALAVYFGGGRPSDASVRR